MTAQLRDDRFATSRGNLDDCPVAGHHLNAIDPLWHGPDHARPRHLTLELRGHSRALAQSCVLSPERPRISQHDSDGPLRSRRVEGRARADRRAKGPLDSQAIQLGDRERRRLPVAKSVQRELRYVRRDDERRNEIEHEDAASEDS